MASVGVGDLLTDFEIQTIKKGKTQLSQIITTTGKTLIIFLRYFGCTLCQYDLLEYSKVYPKVKELGGELLIVLQSTADSIDRQAKEVFPFDIICDANQDLYKALEIEPIENLKKAFSKGVALKATRAKIKGITHGEYEGNENQLPAYFVVDPTMKVLTVHHSKTLDDVPTYKEVMKLINNE